MVHSIHLHFTVQYYTVVNSYPMESIDFLKYLHNNSSHLVSFHSSDILPEEDVHCKNW